MIYVKFYLETLTPEEIMDNTIERMLPWKNQIENKKDDFFYTNKKIFGFF